MKNLPPPTPVSAHYYVYGIPRVVACATLTEALIFCRQAYDDPKLGAVAFEIRFAVGELGGLSWKRAFERVLAGHDQYCGRRIDKPDLFPKCVTANYRAATSRANRAFLTLVDALKFLDLGAKRQIEIARLKVHLTASDVWQIAPVTLYSAPLQAWDFAVDSVLHSRVLTECPTLTPLRCAA